jgi:hypothetical protein
VEGVTVDQRHLHSIWSLAELVELPGRADCIPKASEPASQYEDSLYTHAGPLCFAINCVNNFVIRTVVFEQQSPESWLRKLKPAAS